MTKKTKLQNFWDQIKEKYPEMADMVVDWDEESVTVENKDVFGDMSKDVAPLFAWPPVLPIKRTSVTFQTETGSYIIKIIL